MSNRLVRDGVRSRLAVGLLVVVAAAVLWLSTRLGIGVSADGTISDRYLDPATTLRVVLPAATALIVGLQRMFGACLLSVLSLRGGREERRRESAP